MDLLKIGQQGEKLAEKFLKQQGLNLVSRNERCRFGEIDLIMSDGSTLVFVEVRQRKHQQFGGGAASVDYRKQHKLILTANYWLANHKRWLHSPCRFDVISIDSSREIDRCMWYKDAFRPE